MQEEVEKFNYIPDDGDNKKNKKYLVANIFLFAVIIVLITLLIVFSTVFTTVTVSGESMYPNLVENDKLFLQTCAYKLSRGDIVVFSRTDSEGKTINAVKRIIAMGGDTVAFDKENNLWIINGEPLDEPYFNGEYSANYFDKMYDKDAFYNDGITVPEDCLFVLGDNRNISGGGISVDSHVYGPIPLDSVVGKVISVY